MAAIPPPAAMSLRAAWSCAATFLETRPSPMSAMPQSGTVLGVIVDVGVAVSVGRTLSRDVGVGLAVAGAVAVRIGEGAIDSVSTPEGAATAHPGRTIPRPMTNRRASARATSWRVKLDRGHERGRCLDCVLELRLRRNHLNRQDPHGRPLRRVEEVEPRPMRTIQKVPSDALVAENGGGGHVHHPGLGPSDAHR